MPVGRCRALVRPSAVWVERLHRTCELFGLFSNHLGNVLEIGPFFGYTPFLLRKQSSAYTVLEGNDPVVRPLESIYRQQDITLNYVDFFELFGPTRSAPHQLPLADATYDTILCWETMEHFNFNPVKFVRELHRVLKPGGVFVIVPNAQLTGGDLTVNGLEWLYRITGQHSDEPVTPDYAAPFAPFQVKTVEERCSRSTVTVIVARKNG